MKASLSSRAAVATSLLVGSGLASAGTVEPSLEAALRSGAKEVPVVVFLSRQHVAEAMDSVAPRHQPYIDALAEEMRLRAQAARAMPHLDRRSELLGVRQGRYQVDSTEMAAYARRLERLRDEMVNEAVLLATANSVFDFAHVKSVFAQLGGSVHGSAIAMSTVFGSLPADSVRRLAKDPRISLIALDMPGSPELDVSVPTINASAFWSAGVTGGPHDAGILDTGVTQSHPAFAGKRFESNMGTGDTGSHGTAVCGMTCSVNATYRGVAHGVDTISMARAGNDATSMSGMNFLMTGVTERAENVNYSFGNGTANGTDYASIDQFFDGVADTFGVMVSKSTGNGGFSSGAPTITHPAPAYNIMAVAAIDDLNTVSRADDRIASYSSTGPTLSGRKKPDVAAPGSNINSALTNGTFGGTGSGTSYAAPHVGGSIILLAAAGTPSRLAGKAVLINTAQAMDSKNTSSTGDDVLVSGSFWDRRYGWGYTDLAVAQLHASDVFERDMPAPPNGGRSFKLFKGSMNANDKATLTWNRHVAFNGSSYPTIVRSLSNLDLNAYRTSDGGTQATSASTIDNVEQLSVTAAGAYAIKVLTTGSFDPAVPSERFAIATEEGFTEATGPIMVASWQTGIALSAFAPFEVRATVRNNGDLPAFGITAEFKGFWDIVSGTNPQSLGVLNPGESRDAVWIVKRKLAAAFDQPRIDVRSNSYGENWLWTLNHSYGG
ncbi:MAG: S8 family serine peptidase [Fimbriimonadaceae bacterium]